MQCFHSDLAAFCVERRNQLYTHIILFIKCFDKSVDIYMATCKRPLPGQNCLI